MQILNKKKSKYNNFKVKSLPLTVRFPLEMGFFRGSYLIHHQ